MPKIDPSEYLDQFSNLKTELDLLNQNLQPTHPNYKRAQEVKNSLQTIETHLNLAIEAIDNSQYKNYIHYLEKTGSLFRDFINRYEFQKYGTFHKLQESFDKAKRTSNKNLIQDSRYDNEEALRYLIINLQERGLLEQRTISNLRNLYAFNLSWVDPHFAKKREKTFKENDIEEVKYVSERSLTAKAKFNRSSRHNINLGLILLNTVRDNNQRAHEYYGSNQEQKEIKKKDKEIQEAMASYMTRRQKLLFYPGKYSIAALFSIGCGLSIAATVVIVAGAVFPALPLLTLLYMGVIAGAITTYANWKLTKNLVPSLLFSFFGYSTFLRGMTHFIDKDGEKQKLTGLQYLGLLVGLVLGFGAGATNGALICLEITQLPSPALLGNLGFISAAKVIFPPLGIILGLVATIALTAVLMRAISGLFQLPQDKTTWEKTKIFFSSLFKDMRDVLNQKENEFIEQATAKNDGDELTKEQQNIIKDRIKTQRNIGIGIGLAMTTLAIFGLGATVATGGLALIPTAGVFWASAMVVFGITGEVPFAIASCMKLSMRLSGGLCKLGRSIKQSITKQPDPIAPPKKDPLEQNAGEDKHSFWTKLTDILLCGLNAIFNGILIIPGMAQAVNSVFAGISGLAATNLSFAATMSNDSVDPNEGLKNESSKDRQQRMQEGEDSCFVTAGNGALDIDSKNTDFSNNELCFFHLKKQKIDELTYPHHENVKQYCYGR